MNLDDDELEIAALALRRFRSELGAQLDGAGVYSKVVGAAWHACTHCRAKAEALIIRIEQFQADQAEEKDDGNTAGS